MRATEHRLCSKNAVTDLGFVILIISASFLKKRNLQRAHTAVRPQVFTQTFSLSHSDSSLPFAKICITPQLQKGRKIKNLLEKQSEYSGSYTELYSVSELSELLLCLPAILTPAQTTLSCAPLYETAL